MATPELEYGLRVLNLDGPPLTAAALSELFFLQQIAHRWVCDVDEAGGREGDGVRASEMFDIIGGCGLGGLYAILFARLNMTIGQVIKFHHILQEKLFMADFWFRADHDGCIKAFDDVLDQIVSDSVDLNSPFLSKDCKKCFIVLLNENATNPQSPRCLRSYRVRTASSLRCTIRQALHATLADLEHLPAVIIDNEHFISALTALSNPSRILLDDLAITFPTAYLACCVNLGADYTCPANDSRRVGQDLLKQFQDLGCFFRLSVSHELHAQSEVKTLVMSHLLDADASLMADDAVEAIKRGERVVSCLRPGNLAGEDGKNKVRADVSHLRNEGEIKHALEKIRATYDFLPLREHGCLEGTREDILQQIDVWSEDDDAPNVFWLEGYPGTGKTAISITLEQRLAEARRLGASCFFRREDASQHRLSTLFRSIASQLISNQGSIGDKIVQVVNSGAVALESAPLTLFEKLVCDPLVAASEGFSEPVVLVLDAMDEYGRSDEDRMRLVKLLLPRWIQLPCQFKLFVASRSQGDLPQYLNVPSHAVQRLEVGSATSIETQSDIRRFLDHSFEEIRSDRGNSLAFVTSSELDKLVFASAGLFIWASTVVEMVRLKRKHAQQILRDLRDKGTTIGEIKMDPLHQIYSTILQPLLDDDDSVISFLSAVICARAPLPAPALSSLCKLDVYDIEDTARQLGPVMDAVNGLRFVHKSFVDYIVSQYSPVKLSIDSAERMFATSCFEIMNAQLRFNMGNMPSSYIPNSEFPKLHKALSEELRYASRFWGVHLAGIRNEKNQEKKNAVAIAESIKRFLHHHFLYWVEVVSIFEIFRDAMEALLILKVAGLGEATSDFAQDALAFLRQFAFPISWSYTQIYVSALPWAPARSLVRKMYIETVPNVLKVTRNGDESWPAQLAAIGGHSGRVLSVAFSPDGSQIVSGSSDNTVRIWDAASLQPVGELLRGHTDSVESVAFSPDGSQVVSGSVDNTVRIWDAANRQPVGEPLRGHSGRVLSVAFSPDGSQIASGSSDNTVRIWDIVSRQPVGEPLRGHSDWVLSVAFAPDGSQIVSGSSDNTVRIWDATSRQPVGKPLRGHSSRVLSVAFAPDGSQIVSGSSDNTVRIWDAASRQPVGEPLRGHSGRVWSVAFSPSGSRIVSGSSDNTVRIWDAASRQPVGEPLRGHSSWVLSVSFSPDGSQIVSGSSDNTVRIWDAASRQPLGKPLRGHSGKVFSVSFSPDGSQIVSGSSDNTVRIWDAASRQPVGEPLRGHSGKVWSVAFSPDGSQIVSGSEDTLVRIWDTASHQPVGEPLRGPSGTVWSVAFSPDGSQIVSGSEDSTVRIWDAVSCQPLGEPLRGHSGRVLSVVFSPTGPQIASGSSDNTVRIWDAASRQPVGEPLQGHSSRVRSVAFSPGNSQIISGSSDNTVRIWDAASRQPVGEPLRGHSGWVLSVSFSPDGSQIISGSSDKTVRIWDTASRQPVGEPLRGHSGKVLSVAFSPDGSQIVSGSEDNSIRIWDATHQPAGCPHRILNTIKFSYASPTSPSSYSLLDDGWLVDKHSCRVVWIPHHLHEFLPTLNLVGIISSREVIVADLLDMRIGTDWALCIEGGE